MAGTAGPPGRAHPPRGTARAAGRSLCQQTQLSSPLRHQRLLAGPGGQGPGGGPGTHSDFVSAPGRQAAESLASELARVLPVPNPLTLSAEQKTVAGESLARMLKSRIAYHHSGLSYAARAGVVEPLAKAGQLRVVVATMGLAAGINFSLRSVALAAA